MAAIQSAVRESVTDVTRTIERLKNAITVFATPYNAGYNCGATGPTEINCHPCWTSSSTLAYEWELGKRHGERWKIAHAAAPTRRLRHG